ncbi:GNAT family N-acetyltransferase [Pseudoalteromonas sp. SSDWG2]|uniref:GNAT family N-acetyltransferase n=1 Tax=Pseudoalteromonas sp. SSDWG2 TaxID=3139391 RepID=UPI003BA87332
MEEVKQDVLIRKGNYNDAHFIMALLNEPSFIKHIGDKQVTSEQSAKEYIDNTFIKPLENNIGAYMVTLPDGTPIGMVGLFQRPQLDAPDLGFALLEQYHRKGLMYDTCELFLSNYTQRWPHLYAVTSHHNNASFALLNKLGFSQIGEVTLDGQNEPSRLLRYQ